MPRKISLGWRGARFGLTLTSWASLAVGYCFMLNAATMFALAPTVFGRQFFTYAGFGVVFLLASVFLTVIRRSVQVDSDALREQIVFVALFFSIWLLSIVGPGPTSWLVTSLAWLTPYVLSVAAGLALIGFFYCLTAIGNPINWSIALVAFAALACSLLFFTESAQPAWLESVIPEKVHETLLFKYSLLSGTTVACVAVFLHGIFLRRVANHFKDTSTSEFVTGFLSYHLFASVGLWAALAWLVTHPIQPVLEIGEVRLDAVSVSLSGISSLLIAIGAIWLSSCEQGARAVIGVSREAD